MQSPDRCFWFGTLEHSQWLPTPMQGAEANSEAWSAGGTLLNGGGYQLSSWGSHKTYAFEWPERSGPEMVQVLKSYFDGSYGRGLLYFHDPITYGHNVLPARVADPSMACDTEGSSLVYGLTPTSVVTADREVHNLPVRSAVYDMNDITDGFRGVEDATYVSIPEGYAMVIGAAYSATGSGGVFMTEHLGGGEVGNDTMLTKHGNDDELLLTDVAVGIPGVWIWVGKDGPSNGSVTIAGIMARFISLAPLSAMGYGQGAYGLEPYGGFTADIIAQLQGGWVGGMGHSGARFTAAPTWSTITTTNGGRVKTAASFREVGSWVYG